MADDKQQPIIIIKKKGGHGGHHGGAWKVAYADFVTAMMAFFMVMWLLNSSEKVKEAVAGYFTDPSGYKDKIGSGMAGAGESVTVSKDDMPELKEKLEQALKEMPEFEQVKDQVKFTVTGEGLRVELLETENGMFFNSGSSSPSTEGKEILEKMAAELAKLPNNVVIEGHTDAKPFSGAGYTNWELSADRANAARKLMQSNGLRPDQVKQVRGFADQHLYKQDDPANASNRRVSIIVQYQDPKRTAEDEEEAEVEGKPDAHGGEHKKDAHGGEDKKAEDKKAEAQKTEAKKTEAQKTEAKKADAQKPDAQKAAAKPAKAEAQKPAAGGKADAKPEKKAEKKARAEKKATESKSAEKKSKKKAEAKGDN